MNIQNLISEARKYAGEFKLSTDWLSAGSVSAAILTPTGKVYTGICIDAACGIGFCAEHAAVADMLKDRETRIEMVVAVDGNGKILPPCGRCRELMMQINAQNGEARVIVEGERTVTLRDLLPFRWI